MNQDKRELKYDVPTYDEVEAHLRQAHALRSEALARGTKWVFERARTGLRSLLGMARGDGDPSREDELKARFLRASSPAHIEPSATRASFRGEASRLRSAGFGASRRREDNRRARASDRAA